MVRDTMSLEVAQRCPACGLVGECACPLVVVRAAHCGECGRDVKGWEWLDDEGKVARQDFPFRAPGGAVRITDPRCPSCGANGVLTATDPDDSELPWWKPAEV